MNLKINHIIICGIIIVLFSNCEYSKKMIIMNNDNNDKCENCGTIIFQLQKDQFEDKPVLFVRRNPYGIINISIKINDIVQFENSISHKQIIRKMVPEGDINISYSIFTESDDGKYYYTGLNDKTECFKNNSILREKVLNIKLKSNEIVYLKIVKSGDVRKRCALVSAEWFGDHNFYKSFQEIAFEVEKVEDLKP